VEGGLALGKAIQPDDDALNISVRRTDDE